MIITVNKTGNVITGTIGSKRYSIPYDEESYETMVDYENYLYVSATVEQATDAINRAQQFVNSKTLRLVANSERQTGSVSSLHEVNGKVYLKSPSGIISSIEIPTVLVERMYQAYDENLPVDPFIKSWTLMLRNPNFTMQKAEYFANYLTAKFSDVEQYNALLEEGYSEQTAKELSTYSEVSITRSGLLSTYKYVDLIGHGNMDLLKEVYGNAPTVHAEDCIFLPPVMGRSGDPLLVNGELTHEVRVGAIHELPDWSQVNTNDNTSCVKGIHVGSQTYIRCYGGRTSFLLNCFISPNDIGAIVQCRGTSDQGALRVKRNFIHSVNVAPNKSIYHESTFLDKVNADWEVEREIAIKETNDLIAKLQKVKAEMSVI